MRVAIAEDSGLIRGALVLLLETAGAEVMLSAATGEELLGRLATSIPDVVITDLKMPPSYTDEGIIIAQRVKTQYPDTGVLVLSAYNETRQAAQLIQDDIQGVGYLLKDNVANAEVLLDALGRVQQGQQVVDPDVVRRLVSAPRRARELDTLTSRELEVLARMAEGHTDAEIGRLLHLSDRTVSDHVGSVFQKLGINLGPGNKRVRAVLKWLRATETG